jgi:peptidoglycan-associated lipoprotein
MKRWLVAAVCAAAIAGCKSTDTEGGAAVEDRVPGDGGATSQPIPPGGTGGQSLGQGGKIDPLKDPSSPLSKRNIFFDFDSYVVKDEYKPMLDAHAKYLRDNRSAKMLLQGNADERGSREYNLGLGQRRADAVRRYLVVVGASDAQIEAVSLGEEKVRCSDGTEDCHAQNRRVDILYVGEF